MTERAETETLSADGRWSAAWVRLHPESYQPVEEDDLVGGVNSLFGPQRQYLYWNGKIRMPKQVAKALVDEWHRTFLVPQQQFMIPFAVPSMTR